MQKLLLIHAEAFQLLKIILKRQVNTSVYSIKGILNCVVFASDLASAGLFCNVALAISCTILSDIFSKEPCRLRVSSHDILHNHAGLFLHIDFPEMLYNPQHISLFLSHHLIIVTVPGSLRKPSRTQHKSSRATGPSGTAASVQQW